MWAMLIPLLGNIIQPIKDYFNYKQKVTESNRELELARIQADKEAIISGNTAQTNQIDYYLKAITQRFRQGFICFVVIPFLISMFFPEYSQNMWHNFEMMPEWYRMLLISVCSVVLGLPVASAVVGQMFTSASKGIEARREYKLEKLQINRKAAFDTLRASLFPKGMTQSQVDNINKALDAGESV